MPFKSLRFRLVVTSISLFSLLFSLYSLAFRTPKTVSAIAGHVVISEVQVLGATADDEFVELYNPTESAVNLTGWRLNKKNASGTAQNLVANIAGTIPAHGYYLVANPEYVGPITPDEIYSASSSAITTNNTIYLYSDAGTTLVDKVGFGTPFESENSAFPDNPAVNGSIERKPGEAEPLGGNGEDSDNNANDFSLRVTSNPQNSTSIPEISLTPTVTLTPTVEPSVTETPSETPSPTLTPTLEPTVSPSPTETPTPTVFPNPTTEPTASPTLTLTLTPVPTLTLSPTPTQTPMPEGSVIGRFHFPGSTTTCRLTFKKVNFLLSFFYIPGISCTRL